MNLHRQVAQVILDKGSAYRDFTPAAGENDASGPWLFNARMREQPVGPNAVAVFACVGRERAIARLAKV